MGDEVLCSCPFCESNNWEFQNLDDDDSERGLCQYVCGTCGAGSPSLYLQKLESDDRTDDEPIFKDKKLVHALNARPLEDRLTEINNGLGKDLIRALEAIDEIKAVLKEFEDQPLSKGGGE